MSLLTSIFRKTNRKRSRSDADASPSIREEQWGAHETGSSAVQPSLPPPQSMRNNLSRLSSRSTLSSAISADDAVLRSRARLSVTVQPAPASQAFDSDATLVDLMGLSSYTIAPHQRGSRSIPAAKVEHASASSKACSCECTCSEVDMPRLRVRDRRAMVRVGMRYAFMFIHSCLTLASLMIALHRRDIILIGMIAGMALAYLVYVPAAFALCLAKTASRFDHVAGEVAYLCVQIGGYLGAGLYPALTLLMTDCSQQWDTVDWETGTVNAMEPWDNGKWCGSLRTSIGLGVGHAMLLIIWLVGLLAVTYLLGKKSRGGPGMGRALQVSTGWLLSGWPISAAEKAKPR